MFDLPYFQIDTIIPTIDADTDESVAFVITPDELHIKRDGANNDLEVNLFFSIESAIELRNFLCFALPNDRI